MMTNTRMILKGFATHIASGSVLVKLALFHKNNYVRKGLSRQEIRTKILFLTTVLFINHPFKDIFKPWIYGLIRLKLSGPKNLYYENLLCLEVNCPVDPPNPYYDWKMTSWNFQVHIHTLLSLFAWIYFLGKCQQ